jgi:hypothetical protein|tara:strand:- start:1059 stop:3008 length:1950 start_codon:yes stop_codon:yes gene_type:complete
MFSSVLTIENENIVLEEEETPRDQLGGGGGTIEERCSSITFEDILPYTYAHFDIVVNEDWDTAEVKARAWVNGSSVDGLRELLDTYLEELYPSGGDGWISTDEKSAVEAVASECIEYALTRIGMRESAPHRGGIGLDWKNATWQDNGVIIQEWNLVPSNHADLRDCTAIGSSSDCVEVPVYPNSERDCDTQIATSEGVDECRIELWMNATMVIPNIDQGNEFTLAFNTSNMTNAVLDFTFPNNPDLRLDMWEECEGRNVEFEPTTHEDAPLRGTCIGDGTSSFMFENSEDLGIKYTLMPHRDPSLWPSGEDLFADFTTSPIPINEPPTWAENAPSDGSWFPSLDSGEKVWANWESVSSWFIDEGPISHLQIDCHAESSMNIYQSADKSFWGVILEDEVGDVTCEATDSEGQSSGNRTWHLGIPISISTSSSVLLNPHPIIINLNEGWPELDIEYGFTQTQNPMETDTTSLTSETTLMVNSIGLNPGPVNLWISISGENLYSINKVYTLDLVKESSPPLISVLEYGWEVDTWKAQGQFSDPDGEEVEFILSINSLSAGTISVSGNSWMTPIINFGLWDEGIHEVKITGCDISSKCSEVILMVNNTHLFEEQNITPIPSEDNEETGFLPGPSIVLTILSLTIGLIYSTRRD